MLVFGGEVRLWLCALGCDAPIYKKPLDGHLSSRLRDGKCVSIVWCEEGGGWWMIRGGGGVEDGDGHIPRWLLPWNAVGAAGNIAPSAESSATAHTNESNNSIGTSTTPVLVEETSSVVSAPLARNLI
ncbi:hypothetical protein LSTR_LSTR007059 [Laodelphax striatellus]|uniref:Uncharacterized protein n=1 Tax=Laodelphax striatellus TaxID=195883 RepID=A0A482WKG1_LAOST|nr:hypothetical protein LSTR_LSTR007059 [Laodelphax striatellus]